MPQGCETLLLALFAMQRFDRQRAFAQKLCQLLGLFDRIDKEDAAADRPGLQDGQQQLRRIRRCTGEEALCQLCRQLLLLLFQKLRKRKAFAQIAADGRRERRREAGALQTCGQLGQDLVQRRTKSQTKHLICLIQNEHGQAFQVDGAFMDVLQQPSRGRNQDMSALFHVFPLKGERLFADQHLMMGVQKEA